MARFLLSELPKFPEPLKPKKSSRTPSLMPTVSSGMSNVAVERSVAILRRTEAGGRNHALNKAAYEIGRIDPSCRPSEEDILSSLLAACGEIGLLEDDGEEACIKTIESGFQSGAQDRTTTLAAVLGTLNAPSNNLNQLTSGSGKKRLRLIPEADCGIGERAPYIVKRFIARGDLVCVFGPPGCGKSVLVPHLSLMIAKGTPFFDHMVKTGDVLYVAAEDTYGLANRIKALVDKHGKSDRLYLVDGLTDLGAESGEQLQELADIIRERQPSLLVLDTVAIAFPGLDENSAEAMSKVVSISRGLTRLGCSVLIVHHDTKQGGGTPRGHSLLNGALDVAVQLKPADKAGIVRGRLTKNRNGSPEALKIAFRIEGQTIGIDEDGDEITSPILIEERGVTAPKASLTRAEQAALTELESLMPDQWVPSDPIPSLDLSIWREACVSNYNVSGSEKRESRAKAFNRTLSGLSEKARILVHDDIVSLPEPKGAEYVP